MGQSIPAPDLRVVQEFAAERMPYCHQMAADVAAYVFSDFDERAPTPAGLVAATEASVASNLMLSLGLLAAGQSFEGVPTTTETRELGRVFAEEGLPLESLVRVCQRGHQYWHKHLWLRGLEGRFADPAELPQAVAAVTDWALQYTERAIATMATEHALAWERHAGSAPQRLLAAVRTVLSDDGGSASIELDDYDLDQAHLAVIVYPAGRGSVDLDAAVDDIAQRLRVGSRLTVAPEPDLRWSWMAADDTTPARLEQLAAPADVGIAVGRPGRGLDGFRIAHEEAADASRLSGRADGVVRFEDVEVVSLLSTDVRRAHRFVQIELGALAAAGDHPARLRETLLAYLEEGDSNLRAAKRLFIHPNTVRYRVGQALEMLPTPPDRRRTRLLLALSLADRVADAS